MLIFVWKALGEGIHETGFAAQTAKWLRSAGSAKRLAARQEIFWNIGKGQKALPFLLFCVFWLKCG
jgi:hypothetical protein